MQIKTLFVILNTFQPVFFDFYSAKSIYSCLFWSRLIFLEVIPNIFSIKIGIKKAP